MAEEGVGQSGFVLLDEERGEKTGAGWAGRLLALGARLSRWVPHENSQLVVTVVLPARDYAALLVSAGWILAQPPCLRQEAPIREIEQLEDLLPVPVRMAIGNKIIAGQLFSTRRELSGTRIHVGKTYWHADKVTHIVADPAMRPDRFGRFNVPEAGSLVRRTGHAESWPAEHCRSGASVAVIGTRSVLVSELDLPVGWEGCEGDVERLEAILRPDDGKRPSWASAIIPGGTGELPEVPAESRLIVLDNATATRWLPEVEAPVIVIVVDGSSADESASESILQARSTARPVELNDIGWTPLPGTHALAFEVPL